MDKETQDLITEQSQVIAMLALRVSVLEKVLLDKKIIDIAEILRETDSLTRDFVKQTQERLSKVASKA